MKCAFAVAAVLFWALSPAAVSKETQRATLHKLNVVALDAQGQPATGLGSADFQIFQDGKRQDIAFFRFTGGWPLPPKPGSGEYSNRTLPAWHATVILIDLLSDRLLSDAVMGREVADSLKNLESSEGLYLYMLTTAGELYPIHPLPKLDTAETPAAEPWTRNITPLLQAALKKLVGIKPVDDQDIKFRMDFTSNALRDLGSQMGRISGRKNIVWVTHGVPIAGYSVSAQLMLDFTNPLREFCQRLEQAQIVVYTVAQSQRGTAVGTPSIQTLEQFAGITGGRGYASDQAGDAIQQARTDSRANYEIAYYSALKPDLRHHKIRVVCGRKEVRLHTEAGFYAVVPLVSPGSLAAGELRSRELPIEIQTAALSPFDAADIGLRVGVSRDPGNSRNWRFNVHIDTADLLPRPTRDPDAGKVSVAFVAYDQRLRPLADPILVTLTPEQFEAAKNGEIGVSQVIPVSGIPKVRAIVFDAELGAVGSVTIPVRRETPAPSGAR